MKVAIAKHTKGPWDVVEDGDRIHIIGPARNCIWIDIGGQWPLAVVDTIDSREAGRQYDECLENARLIAAAPELLHALRHLLHNIKASGKRIDLGLAPEMAAAAIAKATGEAA